MKKPPQGEGQNDSKKGTKRIYAKEKKQYF